jgi:hypothetical protein
VTATLKPVIGKVFGKRKRGGDDKFVDFCDPGAVQIREDRHVALIIDGINARNAVTSGIVAIVVKSPLTS